MKMGNEEKSYYIGNEGKYLKLFLALFAINEGYSLAIKYPFISLWPF